MEDREPIVGTMAARIVVDRLQREKTLMLLERLDRGQTIEIVLLVLILLVLFLRF